MKYYGGFFMSQRKKYNCIIEEIDNKQKKDLEIKIEKKDSLEPWLLTFIERFSSLANEKSLSKKAISDECQKSEIQNPQLKGSKDVLPQPTLSSITNPDSDNVRLPNINHLIVLSKFFNVSIDYLVGLSDTKNVNLLPVLESLGLSENSINLLKFYHTMISFPNYSPFPESGLITDDDGCLDVEKLPQIDSDGFYDKYYIGDKSYSKKDYKHAITSIMEEYPDFFLFPLSHNIKENRKRFEALIPYTNFYSTIDILLSYENGLLLNLLSKYLFSVSEYDNSEYSDAVLLSQIHTCIVRMHDSLRKKAIDPLG